jgi:deoxyribodipyrimidine photo-lyase
MLTLVKNLGCTRVFANIEYEVDELRRDIRFCELARQEGIQATFIHNKCVVEPGVILTKDSKAYAVCWK